MITAASLKSHSVKDLARLADKLGVGSSKSLKKDQLIAAIVRAGKSKAKPKPAVAGTRARNAKTGTSGDSRRESKPLHPSRNRDAQTVAGGRSVKAASSKRTEAKGAPLRAKLSKLPPPKPTNPKVLAKIQKANAERDSKKDLSLRTLNGHGAKEGDSGFHADRNGKAERDRLVLMVRDAYWLHACWEITRASIQRVQAAMAEQWHTARPTLRLLEVESGATTSTSERLAREIPIHGGVNNWYIDVPNPPRSFRVDIGYVGANRRFYGLVRSNVVSTPSPGGSDPSDPHWSDVAANFEKIYALSGGFSDDHTSGDLQELFEERLRRPMRSATSTGFGVGAARVLKRDRDFRFDVDAEMLIFGQTKPGGYVSIGGTPVKVKPDGSFAVRLAMPDKRQVLPLVARSGDGVEHRTIVLAVERNTKVMEPVVKESNE